MIVEVADAAAFIGNNAGTDPTFPHYVTAADRIVKTLCGRELEHGTFIHYLRGEGSRTVFLPEWPVDEILSVRIDPTGKLDVDTVVDDLSVFVVDDNRLIYASGYAAPAWYGYFPRGPRTVRVEYTAGYTVETMPADLVDVTLRLISKLYSNGPEEFVQSENLGGLAYTRFASLLDPLMQSVIDNHKAW
jgi:hypothetical protein